MPTSGGNGVPLYIVSKGRADSRLTNKALAEMRVEHYIVVEESEADEYRKKTERAEILVLPQKYKEEYDVFDDLGLTKSPGPGPARNFAWDHSIEQGSSWHWVMDDNISGFYRFNYNLKTPCVARTFWTVMEDFSARYSNVVMAGPNYFMFVSRKSGTIPPYVLNTRIYSCNLIRNDAPFRWRGRYNEDTDLSLRMLKEGFATVQFNALLQYKMPTQQIKGGNTAEFYADEGTRPKSEMLEKMHPDVARVADRFSRVHHQVDYSQWKTRQLVLRDGVSLPEGVDNYGMILQQQDPRDQVWKQIDRPRDEKRMHYTEDEDAGS